MTKRPTLTALALLACAGLPAHAADPVSSTPAVTAGDACQPAWPSSSLQKKESGTVDMLLLVKADGRVGDAKIVRSSGYRDLDMTSMATVAKCRFVPARQNEQAVASWFPFQHQWIPSRGSVLPVADFNTCAKPQYPKESLRHEQQGRVTLAFLIDTDGKVSESRIEKSSGFPLLDMAAQQGIEKCSFKPGLENGEPAKSWLKMQYVWVLDAPNPAQQKEKLQQARDGAARGDAESTYKLGLYYLNGQGVERDPVEARKWVQQAAEQGWVPAQVAMAMMIMPQGPGGDPEEAVGWFRRAAEQGSPVGQYMLAGFLLHQGKQDEALPLLRQAAQQDSAKAQAMLAVILMRSGGADDLAEAVTLLNKGAAQNDPDAMTELGMCYETGRGVTQDAVQAAALYKRAAVEGNVRAQIYLARLYETGKGVPQDAAKAQELRLMAARPAPPVIK
jgi:TonB family protein